MRARLVRKTLLVTNVCYKHVVYMNTYEYVMRDGVYVNAMHFVTPTVQSSHRLVWSRARMNVYVRIAIATHTNKPLVLKICTHQNRPNTSSDNIRMLYFKRVHVVDLKSYAAISDLVTFNRFVTTQRIVTMICCITRSIHRHN